MGRSSHQNNAATKAKSAALPPEAFDRTPRAQLTFTEETAWLTRFDARGKPTLTYPVALDDVASAFRFFGTTTGLLPEHTLFCSQKGDTARIGIYLAPQVRALTFDLGKKKNTVLRVPMPGFVFVGERTRYWIFAVESRPASERAPLFHAPLPNVNPSGLICAGTVKFPPCAADTIHAAAELFFESAFNHDLSDGKFQTAEPDVLAQDEDDENDEEAMMDELSVGQRARASHRRPSEPSLFQFLQGLQTSKTFPTQSLVPTHVTLRTLIHRGNQA